MPPAMGSPKWRGVLWLPKVFSRAEGLDCLKILQTDGCLGVTIT